MKIQIGRREKVNPNLKAALALVGTLSPNGPKPTVMESDETCDKCKAPFKITIYEDISTGIIWLEGIDVCEKCGHRLSAEIPIFEPLNQEQIEQWFGKV